MTLALMRLLLRLSVRCWLSRTHRRRPFGAVGGCKGWCVRQHAPRWGRPTRGKAFCLPRPTRLAPSAFDV